MGMNSAPKPSPTIAIRILSGMGNSQWSVVSCQESRYAPAAVARNLAGPKARVKKACAGSCALAGYTCYKVRSPV
jgi:hypothetical protein